MKGIILFLLCKYDYEDRNFCLKYNDTSVKLFLQKDFIQVQVGNQGGGYLASYPYDNSAATSLLNHLILARKGN